MFRKLIGDNLRKKILLNTMPINTAMVLKLPIDLQDLCNKLTVPQRNNYNYLLRTCSYI